MIGVVLGNSVNVVTVNDKGTKFRKVIHYVRYNTFTVRKDTFLLTFRRNIF